MWFGRCCETVEDWFHGVSGLFETEHYVSKQQNPEQNGKWGYAQISAHPCESVVTTSDGHNFLVRTPIRVFLDSTESSLSLEFNKIKFSAKLWAENWDGSSTVEEWSVLVFGTSVFGTGFYLKCLGLRMARARNCCWMFCVVLRKAELFGLSPDYFRGQAWPGMTNVCYCCKLNNMLNV